MIKYITEAYQGEEQLLGSSNTLLHRCKLLKTAVKQAHANKRYISKRADHLRLYSVNGSIYNRDNYTCEVVISIK